MNEEWREIEGFEGLYQVSSFGRIKSFKQKKYGLSGHIRKQSIVKDGYFRINLRHSGRTQYILVHRLVAEAFIPNPENKSEINHKNGDKKNNNVENLERSTSSANKKHAYKNGLRSIKKIDIGSWRGFINIFLKNGVFLRQVDNTRLAAEWVREYTNKKADKRDIQNVCNGKQKTAYGFIFRYNQEKK